MRRLPHRTGLSCRRAAVTAVAVAVSLLNALPGGAAGQDPDSAAVDTAAAPIDTMAAPDTAASDTVEAPRPAWAPPRLALTVSAGATGLDELQTQPVTAQRLADDGTTVLRSETLRRELKADGGFTLSAKATLGLTPTWSVRASVNRTDTRLAAGWGGEEGPILTDARATSPDGARKLEIVGIELAFLFRIPSTRPFKPYIALGGASTGWSLEAGDSVYPGVDRALLEDRIVEGVAALGVVVPVAGPVSGHMELGSRFSRTPFRPAADTVSLPPGDSLRLAFQQPGEGPFADAAIELLSGLRFEAGLSFELGRATPFGRPRVSAPAAPGGS